MNTKQQLQQMRYSGLNDQDQWSLLNTNVPLSVLDQHNQVQDEIETRASATRIATTLMSAVAQATATAKTQVVVGKPTVSTPLQNNAQQRKSDIWQEEYAPRYYGKAATGAGAAIAPKNTLGAAAAINPLNRDGQSGDSDGDQGKKESWWKNLLSNWLTTQPLPFASKNGAFLNTLLQYKGSTLGDGSVTPTSTPLKYNIELVTPTPAPRMTPSPKPTPTPSPKPTPTPTPKSAQRETMLNAGFDFLNNAVDNNVPYCFDTSEHNRYGEGKEPEFDCTGLAISFLSKCGSKLRFEAGYISNNCAGMVKSIRGTDYGKITYDYKKDEALPELQRGDFVFYADPENLKLDVHVAVATGEMIYDPVKKEYYPEVIEASAVAKKVTGQYLAYNDTNEDDLYERDHSDQIITHVVQWNLEWDDMN